MLMLAVLVAAMVAPESLENSMVSVPVPKFDVVLLLNEMLAPEDSDSHDPSVPENVRFVPVCENLTDHSEPTPLYAGDDQFGGVSPVAVAVPAEASAIVTVRMPVEDETKLRAATNEGLMSLDGPVKKRDMNMALHSYGIWVQLPSHLASVALYVRFK